MAVTRLIALLLVGISLLGGAGCSSLELDDGAVKVLRDSGRSLLPVGVRGVHGQFARGDMVSCRDGEGREIARGLVNYNADETRRIMGSASSAIESILGYGGDEELIHRDNLVLV